MASPATARPLMPKTIHFFCFFCMPTSSARVAEIWAGWPEAQVANAVTFGGLVVLGGVFMFRPAADGRAALGRCVWLIGWFTLWTQNLFPWYLLWELRLMNLLPTAVSDWLLLRRIRNLKRKDSPGPAPKE